MTATESHPRLSRLIRVTPAATSALVAVCGALVLVGWLIDNELLKSLLHPARVAMNPATALCFILLAASLWLQRPGASTRAAWIARGLAAGAAAVGVIRIIDYFIGGVIRADEILFRSRLEGNVMAPNTAVAFVLTALALLLLDVRTRIRRLHVSQFFVLCVGCISVLALLGYLYQIGALYIVRGYIPMALNTAFCFALLVAGVLCVRPQRQPVVLLLDDTVGGSVARRLLPAAFILPVLLGYLRLIGERRDWFSSDFGLTLFVLGLIVLFNLLIWWNALVQRRVDQKRRLVQEALQLSEERHRAVMEQAADGITLVDAETLRILEVNHAFARLLGYSHKELVGRLISEFIIDTPEGVAARAQQTLGADAPVLTRRRYRRADGSEVSVEKSASVLKIGGRRVLCTVVHDITARERAEAELRQSEERHRAVMEQLAEGIYLVDTDTLAVLDCNPALEALLGYARGEIIGKGVHELVHDSRQSVEERMRRLVATERTLYGERQYRRKDGSSVEVQVSAGIITFGGKKVACTVVHDITERKALERDLQESMRAERAAHEKLKQAQSALVQTEKLAGLGQMVAGVAHEINNPLAFVSNNVAVLQRDLRAIIEMLKLYAQMDSSPEQAAQLRQQVKDLADRIDLEYTLSNLDDMLVRSRDGLKRIQQIVKDLRDFARLDAGDLHEVDLNAGIESTINIVRGLARKKQVTLDLDLKPMPQVACYPAKINQVVMNLVTNAIDACGEGGRVTVRSANENGAVRIEVSDTGRGIPPEIRQRIFDPFFTTKPIGKGTGLGLSISYGIVQDHGGTISVESEVGSGTTFVVTLPARKATG